MNDFLTVLEGVKPGSADGQYMAHCPSHEDRSASLAVKLTDGKVLVHCFAGCSRFEILGAMGLDESDLFEEKLSFEPSPAFKPLELIRIFESQLKRGVMAVGDLSNGRTPHPDDQLTLKRSHLLLQDVLAQLCR